MKRVRVNGVTTCRYYIPRLGCVFNLKLKLGRVKRMREIVYDNTITAEEKVQKIKNYLRGF
jgi:hypothetical protein